MSRVSWLICYRDRGRRTVHARRTSRAALSVAHNAIVLDIGTMSPDHHEKPGCRSHRSRHSRSSAVVWLYRSYRVSVVGLCTVNIRAHFVSFQVSSSSSRFTVPCRRRQRPRSRVRHVVRLDQRQRICIFGLYGAIQMLLLLLLTQQLMAVSQFTPPYGRIHPL